MSKHSAGHHKPNARLADGERAFSRGGRDRLRGLSYYACPYSDKAMEFEWQAGWAAMNNHLAQEEFRSKC